MNKVNKLIKVDLSQSLERIPKNLIWDKIKRLVGSGYFYQLIEDFLNFPIIDDFGMNQKDISIHIPTVCEITRILFDIVLN